MQRLALLCLCAGSVLAAGPAAAARLPDFNPVFPIEHQTEGRNAEQPQAPYAMNYTDELARSLGVKGGRMDLFDSGPSGSAYLPAIKGGVDGGGAMLRLQWHPQQ